MNNRIALGEKLDTAASVGLSEQLKQAVGQPVQLDGTNLRLLGGLSAQLLSAAARRWRQDRCDFELLTSSDMRDDIRRLGLEADLLRKDVQP